MCVYFVALIPLTVCLVQTATQSDSFHSIFSLIMTIIIDSPRTPSNKNDGKNRYVFTKPNNNCSQKVFYVLRPDTRTTFTNDTHTHPHPHIRMYFMPNK